MQTCNNSTVVTIWLPSSHLSSSGKPCPSALTVCEHLASVTWVTESSSPRPAAQASLLTAQSDLQHLSHSPTHTHIHTLMADSATQGANRSSGAIWGFVSCSSTVWHAAGTSDLPITRKEEFQCKGLNVTRDYTPLMIRGADPMSGLEGDTKVTFVFCPYATHTIPP